MNPKWAINSNQSDVLIEAKHSVIAYLGGNTNSFRGYVVMDEDNIEDAAVEFSLNINNNFIKVEQMDTQAKLSNFFDVKTHPTIRFKSTSFQKVNKNINFIKGDLTIKDVTKTLELDTEFIGIHNYDGQQKGSLEVTAKIKRSDFNLWYNNNNQQSGISIGQDIKLVANLEFEILKN
ncbi:MAG: polyisoprenoid-binding protein [Flavobacterium sp.]|jgi:polyisoprenoid-binding protein YceI|nr:MAG: polyisoprenoid-binding protein [Flavobacterium sp.]